MTNPVHSNLLSNTAKLFGNLVRAHNDLEQAKIQYKLLGRSTIKEQEAMNAASEKLMKHIISKMQPYV